MADVDDFFAKRDKKKKGSKGKKFDTVDDVAKVLEQKTKERKRAQEKNNYVPTPGEAGDATPPEQKGGDDDEWKEVEDSTPDLTGLKIQELVLEDEDDDKGKDGENREELEGQKWTWSSKKPVAEAVKPVETQPEIVVNNNGTQPDETPPNANDGVNQDLLKDAVGEGLEETVPEVEKKTEKDSTDSETNKINEEKVESTPAEVPAPEEPKKKYIPPSMRAAMEAEAKAKAAAAAAPPPPVAKPIAPSSNTETSTASAPGAAGGGSYVPPWKRSGASSTSSSSAAPRKKTAAAPNINDQEYFPELGS